MIKDVKQNDSIVSLYLSVKEAIFFLVSSWLTVLLIGICAATVSTLYMLTVKQTYKSTLTFVVDGGNEKAGGYSGIAAQFGIDLGQSGNLAFEGDNLLEMFRSRSLVERTLLLPYDSIGQKQYIEVYIDNHNLIPFKNITHYDSKHLNTKKDSIVGVVYNSIIKNQLVIQKRDKKSSIIQIDMIDGDEKFAQKFITSLSNVAVKFYTDYKTTKAKQNLDILQFQADSLIRVINAGISDISTINDVNVNSIKQISRYPIQKRNFNVTVATAVYTEVLKQLEYAKITFRKETPLIQLIDVPILPLQKMRPSRLYTCITAFFLGALAASVILLIKRSVSKIKLVQNL